LHALPRDLANALASVTALFGAGGQSNAETGVARADASQPAITPEVDTPEADSAISEAGMNGSAELGSSEAGIPHDASAPPSDSALREAGSQQLADAGPTADHPAPIIPHTDDIAHCRRVGDLVALFISSAGQPTCDDCAC